jgi:iron complex outermembrane recepter protein
MKKALLVSFVMTLPGCQLLAADVNIAVTTPARMARSIGDVPGSVEVVTPAELKKLPGATLDEKLSAEVPGLASGRSNGIYSFTSPLTMRGFSSSEQGRTLILLDGVPVNTGATGAVNWNRLSTEEIDRVEVFKGPASSLYGSNASAGVINIITRKQEGYSAAVSYGTYDTLITRAGAGVKTKKFFVSLTGNYLKSAGYISTPRISQDIYSVRKYVNEKTAELNSSLDLGDSGKVDIQYSHNDGLRGEGSRVLSVDGNSRRYRTDFTRAAWNGEKRGLAWQAQTYYQRENYLRINEYYRSSLYNRVDTNGLRTDAGAQGAVSMELPYGLLSTFGADYKAGLVNAVDEQWVPTASYANDQGKMDIYAPYFQAEKKLAGNRLKLLAGLRYDNAYFHDGFFGNTNSSYGLANGPLDGHHWDSFSPKISAGWEHSSSLSQYVSYGRGFRPPALEDMCLSMLRGSGATARFTLANPSLKPEKVGTIETGFRFNPAQGLYLEPSAYYTRGSDFIYEVNTGGVINISGSNKTVYRKQNVSGVEIYGGEAPVKFISGDVTLSASYAWSHSKILHFDLNPWLEGNKLTYAPRHIVALGADVKTKVADLGMGWKYKSRQFTDDADTVKIPHYSTLSASVSRRLSNSFTARLNGDNLLDVRYQESTTDRAPGRNVTATLEAKF